MEIDKENFKCGTIYDILTSPNVDHTVGGKCSECGACCADVIPISSREAKTIKAYIKRHRVEPVRHVAAGSDILDGVCPFCDTGKPRKKCRIYSVRPGICRRWICSHPDGRRAGGATRMLVSMWEVFYGEDHYKGTIDILPKLPDAQEAASSPTAAPRK